MKKILRDFYAFLAQIFAENSDTAVIWSWIILYRVKPLSFLYYFTTVVLSVPVSLKKGVEQNDQIRSL